MKMVFAPVHGASLQPYVFAPVYRDFAAVVQTGCFRISLSGSKASIFVRKALLVRPERSAMQGIA